MLPTDDAAGSLGGGSMGFPECPDVRIDDHRELPVLGQVLSAYYEPIKTAMALMPFVGADRADDVAHNFFLKLYEHDLLANRPAITGRFRDWLYVAARHHAIDESRKVQRRRERADAFEGLEPADRAGRPARMPRSTPTSAMR